MSAIRILTAIDSVLSITEATVRAWFWLAGLVQLLFVLFCTAVAEYGPIIGRYAGRFAGTVYRLGKQARPVLLPILTAIDYQARKFVESQAGDHPIADWASPAIVVLHTEPQQLPDTRRELLVLAKSIGLPNYSRLTTEELRLALA